jgi:hypothetical protein
MRSVIAFVAVIAWALWLGGLVTLLIFVLTLFHTDRTTALQAAPQMFVIFGKYQLILSAVGLISTFFWRVTIRSKWITSLFAIVAVCAMGGAVLSARIVPRMEEIRLAGQSHDSAEYKSLHGRSSIIYTSEAALLLIGAIILPLAIVDSSRQTGSKSSLAQDSQA